ncbi:hypothetical protein K456DRAFT_1742309 [Colletotrichum gloeosporioides 23]|nr:hypothetical protein K456DRAFT_1742309 [Colletotrichum gloeosporioides 23]
MHYEFDGYSEASNSPGRAAAARAQGGGQNRDQRQDHNNSNRSREESNQYPDGFYRGTGRFARENFETERRERGQQQQQQRTFGASPYRSAAFEYMDTGGRGRSEEEWGRVFMEAFRRRAGGSGGGSGSGGGGRMGMDEREGYGGRGYEPRGYGAEREMGFEEFLSGVFGGGGFGGRFGPEAIGYGYGSGGGGGVGVSFEEMFGPPPGFGEGSSPGAGGGYGGGGGGLGYNREADEQNERNRRGGAGMTRDEFDNMFRARFEGPGINGYASGPPPADLFDRWYTDW